MRGVHEVGRLAVWRAIVGTFALSSAHLVFPLVFFCSNIVYIGTTAQHESTNRAAT